RGFHLGLLVSFLLPLYDDAMELFAPDVDHWCARPAQLRNLSTEDWKKQWIPRTAKGDYERCSMYDDGVWRPNRSTVPCARWEYDGRRQDHTIVQEWDLVCERAWFISLGSNVFYLGGALALPICGPVADCFGRRPALLASVALLELASAATLFVHSINLLVALRFCLGAATSIVFLVTFVLVLESLCPEDRTLLGVAVQLGRPGGRLVVALLRLNRLNWHAVHTLTLLPTGFLLVALTVDESSLWLECAKGPIRPLKEPCLPRFGAVWTVESTYSQHKPAQSPWSESSRCRTQGSWISSTRYHSDKVATLVYCWVVLSLTIQIFPWSVALKPLVPDAQAILLAAVQVPADCVLMLATAKFPREVVQGSLLLTTGLFSALELLLIREAVLVPRATLAALTSMSTGAASLLLTLSTAELFPTRIRASALGLCRATSEVIRLLRPPYEA
ncbi:unnamed protein product, partial [Ixodes persulcatus]